MQLLDGKQVAKDHQIRLKARVEKLWQKKQVRPGLAVVLVGENPASEVYVKNKVLACGRVGLASFEHRLPASVSLSELKDLIEKLNRDSAVHGILVQLPLPQGLQEEEVLACIRPEKDADGLTSQSFGLLMKGRPQSISCTPNGVIQILEYYNIPLEGQEVVVVGRSQIVGLPMAQLLQMKNATVTLCHSKTKNLSEHTKRADIVVVAAGRPEFLGAGDFKKGAVIIDVGIHRINLPDGKTQLVGDVRFEELKSIASAMTPVPGGVGPMTISMLLENTIKLAENSTMSV